MRSFITILILVIWSSVATAVTLTVRQDGTGDFLNITDAVGAANAGDVIEVGAGTYTDDVIVTINLDFVSVSGASSTTWDGQNAHRMLFVKDGAVVNVQGFTFTNGNHAGSGGAMLLTLNCTTVVEDCVFTNNRGGFDGGAFIVAIASDVTFRRCLFTDNYAPHNGAAGNAIQGSFLNIEDCHFENNRTDTFSGALASNDGSMNVSGSLFVGNVSGDVAGAIYYFRSNGSVEQNTFWENESPGTLAGTVVLQRSPFAVFTRNIVSSAWSGFGLRLVTDSAIHGCNVYFNNADGPVGGGSLAPDEVVASPLFCGSSIGAFEISQSSPAAPAQSPCGALIGAFGVACSVVATEEHTWGGIKALYAGAPE